MVLLLSTMVFFTTVSAGSTFGVLDFVKGTEGENSTVHMKNPESLKYYPVNKNGYTFGKYGNAGVMPDLMYIEEIKGKEGYVYTDEYLNSYLNSRPDSSTQDLDSYNKQQQDANRICNIYLSDGETMIGTYN